MGGVHPVAAFFQGFFRFALLQWWKKSVSSGSILSLHSPFPATNEVSIMNRHLSSLAHFLHLRLLWLLVAVYAVRPSYRGPPLRSVKCRLGARRLDRAPTHSVTIKLCFYRSAIQLDPARCRRHCRSPFRARPRPTRARHPARS